MTLTRKRTNPKLSRIVTHNDTVYLCGQVAEGYADHSDDIAWQTRGVLARIDEHLAEAGTDKTRMVMVTVYIKRREDIAQMNDIWCDWLKECEAPARCCVVTDLGNPTILVEMTVTAAL